jgi:hypothetical protein
MSRQNECPIKQDQTRYFGNSSRDTDKEAPSHLVKQMWGIVHVLLFYSITKRPVIKKKFRVSESPHVGELNPQFHP